MKSIISVCQCTVWIVTIIIVVSFLSGCASQSRINSQSYIVPDVSSGDPVHVDAKISVANAVMEPYVQGKIDLSLVTETVYEVIRDNGGFREVAVGAVSSDYEFVPSVVALEDVFDNVVHLRLQGRNRDTDKVVYDYKFVGWNFTQTASLKNISEVIVDQISTIRSAIHTDLQKPQLQYAAKVIESGDMPDVQTLQTTQSIIIDIEQNLPNSKMNNNNAIAVVIGNSDYKKTKIVEYAINDAKLVKKYLIEVLGYKEGNIFYYVNASRNAFELLFGNERNYKGKLYNAVKEGKSDVFVYYSGHGAPGLKDKKGYFVPINADPQYLELSGYPADVFYNNLSKIPARSITIALDACFSGATVYDNISPMVLEINNPVIDMANAVVLSSSSGTQVSSWYNEKKHGMFTYFFLKAIHNKNADENKDNELTFDEIYKYISDKTEGVPYYARRIHGVEQNPTIEGQYQGKVLVEY